MSVDTPALLAVLAHELRGSVSTLQGYLRLLERGSEPPDQNVIGALQRSCAKLAALGQDASDLVDWLRPSAQPPTAVRVGSLLEAAAAASRPRVTASVAPMPAALSARTVPTPDPPMLARALAAVAVARSREQGDLKGVFEAGALENGVEVRFRTGAAAPAPETPAVQPRAVAFDAGGQGLALVLAAHVLDTHGATTRLDTSGALVMHLPAHES